ncbi:MAG: hypothetical protein GY851_31535 [bacterium]|nr:hypothetical protein [bacterium]
MNVPLTLALMLQTAAGAEHAARHPGDGVGLALTLGAALAGLLVWVGLKAAYVAFAVWFQAACPQLSARMQTTYETRTVRCYVEGAVHLVVGLFIVALLLNVEVLALLGLLVLLALGICALTGCASAYACLGGRLAPGDGPGPKATVIGGLTMECACILPVLGQLLALGVLIHGLGAAILTLRSRGLGAAARREAGQQSPEGEG